MLRWESLITAETGVGVEPRQTKQDFLLLSAFHHHHHRAANETGTVGRGGGLGGDPASGTRPYIKYDPAPITVNTAGVKNDGLRHKNSLFSPAQGLDFF